MRALARTTAVLTLPLLLAGLVGVAAPQALAAVTAASTSPKVTVPSTFGFTGGGWGHGVGMSQDGAFGMASEGASARTILTHYYTGTTVAPYTDDQEIAVNIAHRVSTVKFRTEALAAGGGSISFGLGGTKVVGKAGDVFVVTVSGTSLVVTKNGTRIGSGSSVRLQWSGTRYPAVTGADDSKAAVLDLIGTSGTFPSTGHRYRYGYVNLVARAQSGITRLEAVNVLRLGDEYLRGIGEVPSSWPAAALQAQVIAARSFALVKYGQGFKSGCQCHVDSGHGPYYDQNFVGYSKESSSYGAAWRAAVTATLSGSTAGQVVLYKGKPAEAFYSSSTGGRTQDVKDVWGSDVPYLKSVDDHWSTEKKYNPYATWGPYVRTQKQVAAAFGLPDVATMDLTQRYVSGALKSVTATSSAGKQATLPVDSFVGRLSLLSNWVRSLTPLSANVGAPGGPKPPKVQPATLRAYPLATAKGAKLRYFGYRAAHPTLPATLVVDGTGSGAAATVNRANVKLVQAWLAKLGYLHGSVDGIFGPATDSAVKAFQNHDAYVQDGLVGGGTDNKSGIWKALQVEAARV